MTRPIGVGKVIHGYRVVDSVDNHWILECRRCRSRILVSDHHLRLGEVEWCKCRGRAANPALSGPHCDYLVGQTYGRLFVYRHTEGGWLCACTCGNIITLTTQQLKYGRVRSCGCLQREAQARWIRANHLIPRQEVMKQLLLTMK